jgi:hypothetical protein
MLVGSLDITTDLRGSLHAKEQRVVRALVALGLLLSSAAAAAPYAWRADDAGAAETLVQRFPTPSGWTRVAAPTESFAAWLRELPLEVASHKVMLFDGREKPRQDVHAAVVAIDIGTRDLQQCADAIMRLWSEYRFSQRLPVEFHPDPGRPRALRYDPRVPDPRRDRFRRWLVQVFADAGSASLQAELPRGAGSVEPGDVLIQGGHPGHAVLVLDAISDGGRRRLLLGQSYMPAQSFHVLKNLGEPALGAWFDEATLDTPTGLVTPEWRPFHRNDVHRFPN